MVKNYKLHLHYEDGHIETIKLDTGDISNTPHRYVDGGLADLTEIYGSSEQLDKIRNAQIAWEKAGRYGNYQ